MSRLVSGRGVIAAKRSRNSSGSNTSSRVPSCHAVFSSSAMRPSFRSRRRSCAKGGRHMWQFDLRTAAAMGDAEAPVTTYRIKQDSGDLYVWVEHRSA
jgi:hypothetical protein